ncbi:hypothetical protein [Halorhodospira halophila]|uniref:hypothetical protein n=1 Tax=Halorhodospira halophila TaxID=1053 RepID=UPI001912EC92|nr:hypothetical protein [Halorhodospira halophila]MBK5942453.1 hypothetical protein [Halorhodospira halophila]
MNAHRLRLRIPGLLGPLPGRLPPGVLARQPALETWLARGRHGPLTPSPVPEAAGALGWLADGGDPGCEAYWSRAQPLHLRPEAAGVRLVQVAINEFEAARLETDLADLLAGRRVQLHRTSAGRWYLQSQAPLPERPAPEQVCGRFIDAYLPRGGDALRWATLFNEVEMALCDHPVNRDREERGEPPINALWAWGSGRCPTPPASFPWQRLFSDDPAWLGLGVLAGAEVADLAGSTPILPGPDTLVAVPWAEQALAVDDGAAWIDAVAAVERAIAAPALVALREAAAQGSRWDALELCFRADDHGVTLGRRELRRFWRRPRPLGAWVREGGEDA